MTDADHPWALPRMTVWLLLSVLLFIAAVLVSDATPGSVLAVTLHKAHLMSLGGWGGYWLDRGLFPYARPHTMLDIDLVDEISIDGSDGMVLGSLQSADLHWSMLRRALIVVGCLICVGLGA